MTKQADLIAYVFDGRPHLLSSDFRCWMEASSRFTLFVETYRDKIRKKIRLARDPESIFDLRSELEVAYCLLNDRRLAVAYEPYASEKRRGPDFAVTYRVNLVFNIEVARLRGERSGGIQIDLPRKEVPGETPGEVPGEARLSRHLSRYLLRILLDKMGQMQPGMPNLLVIHTPDALRRSIEMGRLMQEVKKKVEGNDPAFYLASRYASPAAFYKDFLRLSGILLWAIEPQLWVNKQARPALEEKVMRLVSSLPRLILNKDSDIL